MTAIVQGMCKPSPQAVQPRRPVVLGPRRPQRRREPAPKTHEILGVLRVLWTSPGTLPQHVPTNVGVERVAAFVQKPLVYETIVPVSARRAVSRMGENAGESEEAARRIGRRVPRPRYGHAPGARLLPVCPLPPVVRRPLRWHTRTGPPADVQSGSWPTGRQNLQMSHACVLAAHMWPPAAPRRAAGDGSTPNQLR